MVLTASLLAAPGCSPIIGGRESSPTGSRVLDGQVWAVDSRRGRLQVRSTAGRTNTLNVDRATRVMYRRRSYPMDALERGDMVRVWLEVDRRGDAWADRVEVRQSVRERYDRYGDDEYAYDDRRRAQSRAQSRVERLEGRVRDVSVGSGYFTVEEAGDHVVAVYFPPAIDPGELRRIERLRSGDRVRADVRPLSGSEAELVRMR